MCIVQHVELKSVFTFQPTKRLVSTTVKNAKPAATFWIFLLRTKNRHLCCLAVTVHLALLEKRVAITKIRPFPFSKNFLRQSQPSTSELEPKKDKSSPNMKWTYPFPIGSWFEPQFKFLNHFIQFQYKLNQSLLFNIQSTYGKSWSSPSPTMESSGLSILVPTLLLLQWMISTKI